MAADDSRPADHKVSRAATRYLCAAAYLDHTYRNIALRWVLNAKHTAVAPSYSIDIVPILRHCLHSQRLESRRNRAIVTVVFLALIIVFREAVFLLILNYGLKGLRRVFHIPEPAFKIRSSTPKSWWSLVTLLILSVLFFIFVAGSAFSAPLTAGAAGATAHSGKHHVGVADVLRFVGLQESGAILGFIFVAALIEFWYRMTSHRIVLNSLVDTKFDPQRAPSAPRQYQQRINYLAHAQYGNVTMYAKVRQDNPFIGCGEIRDFWAFAVPLIPETDASASQTADNELTVSALYSGMRGALSSLADSSQKESSRIQGLALQDRIFVPGLLSTGHPLITVDKEPRLHVTAEELDYLARNERNKATHYLTVRISGWEGELDVTVHLFFSVRGNMLYSEFMATALPPIKEAYQAVDAYEKMTMVVVGREARAAFRSLPSLFATTPKRSVLPVLDSRRRQSLNRSEVEWMSTHLAYDFGAYGSIREFGSELESDNLFHELDSGRYIEIIGRRVIDATAEVLSAAGYQTDAFVDRASVNIDNSVKINNLHAANSAVAVGRDTQASASNSTSTRTSRNPHPRNSRRTT